MALDASDKQWFESKLQESEQRVILKINREITDLAETVRAVVDRTSQIPDLEARVTQLEQVVGRV